MRGLPWHATNRSSLRVIHVLGDPDPGLWDIAGAPSVSRLHHEFPLVPWGENIDKASERRVWLWTDVGIPWGIYKRRERASIAQALLTISLPSVSFISGINSVPHFLYGRVSPHTSLL